MRFGCACIVCVQGHINSFSVPRVARLLRELRGGLALAGVCTLVYLSGALSPTQRPDNEHNAANFEYYNKKAGVIAVAATYLCKPLGKVVLPRVDLHSVSTAVSLLLF